MDDSTPRPHQVTYVIATDVRNGKESVVKAQVAVKTEIEDLFNAHASRSAFLKASLSPDTELDGNQEVSVWRCEDHPKQATNALNNSKLWLFFTAGDQERYHDGTPYDTFTLRAAQLQAVDRACVFIVFGSCAGRSPPEMRYDVCEKTIEQTSDALLLFHDVDTGQVYLFQAKGCFRVLLGSEVTVDQGEAWEDSKWSTLRRFQYEELLRVQLPDPLQLPFQEQSIIHEGRILSNKQYQALMAKKDVGDPFDMERLQEIIKKAGDKDKYHPRYSTPSLPSSTIPRVDIDGHANHIIHMIFMNLDHRSMGINVPESRLDDYRKDLRAANRASRLAFEQATAKHRQETLEAQQSKRKSFLLPAADPEETFYPGFVRAPATNRKHSEFRAQCMLCHENDTILVLLMHYADLVNEQHLPYIYVSFVIHSMLVCDACAVHIPVQNNHLDRDIVAVLPLVSVIDNEMAWTQAFKNVVGEVKDEEILVLVWKWLNTQLGYDVAGLRDGVYKDAVEWVRRD